MSKQRVLSRQLQRRLEFFILTTQADGFGGSTAIQTSMGFFWARIDSIASGGRQAANIVDLGITDFSSAYKITMRYYAMFENPNKLRIKKGAMLYEIVTVSKIDERGTKVELLIKEHAR